MGGRAQVRGKRRFDRLSDLLQPTSSVSERTRNKVQGARDKEKKLLLLFAGAQFPLNFGHFPFDFPIR